MHSHKLKNPLAIHDSFDNSLKQIHNTNKLLNSIETKLTDFFSNDPKATTPKEENFRENISMIHSRSSQKLHRDENYPNPGLGFVSSPPPHEKDFSQYLSPSDDTRPQRITSPTQFRSQERVKPLTPIDNLPRRDLVNDWDKFERPTEVFENKISPSGHSLIEKMNKIEESYQGKMKILEERLHMTDYEIQGLRKVNERLEVEISKLKGENAELQNLLSKERRRTETESDAMSERAALKGRQKVDEMRIEHERMREELIQLEKRYRDVAEEKDGIKYQYNELMKVHNQMIELDMQKNEKSLREHNISMRRNEEENYTTESFTSYKQELEILRESNSLVQKQLKYEVQRLKDDLRKQKEENIKLSHTYRNEKARWEKGQSSPLHDLIGYDDQMERSPNRSPSRSPIRGTRKPITGDEFTTMSRSELAKFTRGLQESYQNLEGQHTAQLRQNEALQEKLQVLGETSREEVDKFNEFYSEVFTAGANRKTHMSSFPAYADEIQREAPSSDRRQRNSLERNIERRNRLRQELESDLQEVTDIERHGRLVASPLKTRNRSRSKSTTKYTPNKNIRTEMKSPSTKQNETMMTPKSHGDFERELFRLKDMVNQNMSLRTIKEKPSKKIKLSEGVNKSVSDLPSTHRNSRTSLKPKLKTTTKATIKKK